MDTLAKIRFLLRPESLALLEQLGADTRDELALAQSPQLRGRPAAERLALLEQRALRRKAAGKQAQANGMLFTPLGLMQMTSQTLALAKGRRLLARGITTLADLCCGLGGDSMHLPPGIAVIGVDRDAATLAAYRHNVRLHRGEGSETTAVLGDVEHLPVKTEACFVDPARRPKAGMKHWDGEGLMPGLAALENLVSCHEAVGIKLGPGLMPPEVFEKWEWEYLGLDDACLELMIWAGKLGDPDTVRATEWPSGATVWATRSDRDESFAAFADAADDGEAKPGCYLYEPVKCVVRAHLHAVLARRHGLRLFDPRIAYLTGDVRVEDPLLKRYAVLRELPPDLNAIRAVFRAEGIGDVTVKKRGFAIVPEQVRAKVRHAGGAEAATLVFTRIGDRRRVFWVKPEGGLREVGEDEE